MAQDMIGKGEVPGLAIAVVYRDEIVLLEGFGVREVGKSDPVDPDTVFQLASLSKPISSTVVAALVSDGLVSWDNRIRDIDPGFSLHAPYPTAEVTIRDLFAHRSGLAGNVGNDLEDIGFSQGEILQRLHLPKPAFSFRGGYSYSNFGITEGAVAAAHVAGLNWEQASEEKLYKPLGMSSTSSRYRDFEARSNRAGLHVRIDGKWASFTRRNADAQSPAGGASSSARDLAQWMRLELGYGRHDGRQIIKKEAIEQTHIPAIVRSVDAKTGIASFYGLGWNIDYTEHGVECSHAGAFSAGARTMARFNPVEQLGIVVLSSAFPTGVPEALAASFFDFVFTGKPQRDWVTHWNEIYAMNFGAPAMKAAMAPYASPPASIAPALPVSAYAGDYVNDYVGEAKVTESGGSLFLHLGPAGKRFPLRHFNRDVFLYAPAAETPTWLTGVDFLIGPDGQASAVTIESLDGEGMGTLKRRK